MGFLGGITGALSGSLENISSKYDGIFDNPGGIVKLKSEKLRDGLSNSTRRILPELNDAPKVEDISSFRAGLQDSVESNLSATKDKLRSSIASNAASLGPDLTRRLEWELSKAQDLASASCFQQSLQNSIRIYARKRRFTETLVTLLNGVSDPNGLVRDLKKDLGVDDLEDLPNNKINQARRMVNQKISQYGARSLLPPCGKPIKIFE